MTTEPREIGRLFSPFPLERQFSNAQSELLHQLEALTREEVLSVSVEEQAAFLAAQNQLDPLVLNIAKAAIETSEQMFPNPDPVAALTNEYVHGILFTLSVPFIGDAEMWMRYAETPPPQISGAIEDGVLLLRFGAIDPVPEETRSALEAKLSAVEAYLAQQGEAIRTFNTSQLTTAIDELTKRRNLLLRAATIVESLRYPLRVRSGAGESIPVPIARTVLRPLPRPAPSEAAIPEPYLLEEDYRAILKTVEHMATTMEKIPHTFAHLSEEDIRTFFLVILNANYEGAASGETFNSAGKTDILIQASGRNIFIAECKIWAGQKGLIDALDQLLSYLCWRDTKAALFIFNRNKSLSNVIDSARAATKTHPLIRGVLIDEGETRFRCVFGHPNDPRRLVTVTVMIFDIPNPQAMMLSTATR